MTWAKSEVNEIVVFIYTRYFVLPFLIISDFKMIIGMFFYQKHEYVEFFLINTRITIWTIIIVEIYKNEKYNILLNVMIRSFQIN